LSFQYGHGGKRGYRIVTSAGWDAVDAAASARKVIAGRFSRERTADVQDDWRDHSDSPAQKIRHPRNIRILPNSRDFHCNTASGAFALLPKSGAYSNPVVLAMPCSAW
jgi:hypothetical protein